MDKERNILSFRLFIQVLQYETAILRADLESASLLLHQIPQEEYNRLGKFLDQHGYKELAMEVTRDDEHRFEIALQLNDLDKAYEIIKISKSALETKWKQLGQLALSQCNIKLAQECFTQGNDYGGLLLLFTSTGDREGMKKLAELCLKNKLVCYNNIAFMCYYLLGDVDKCIDLLIETRRIPEAALFARTYAPSQVSHIVELWRSNLTQGSGHSSNELSSQRLKTIAESLANPKDYSNLFPSFEDGIEVEKYLRDDYYKKLEDHELNASDYSHVKQTLFGSDGNGVDFVEQYKQCGDQQQFEIPLLLKKEHDE